MYIYMLYTYGEKILHETLLNKFHWRWIAALEYVIDSFASTHHIYITKLPPFVGGGIGLRTGKHK